MKAIFKLIIAIGVSLGAGVVGSIFTGPAVQSAWYATLVKPALNPPAWVFGPVWTTLFVLMGISLFLIWKSDPAVARKERRRGVILFFIQLILNTLWSIIFFAWRSPGGALVEIILLWLAILATLIAFARISRTAAWLLVPYLAWVSFATYLNYSLYVLN